MISDFCVNFNMKFSYQLLRQLVPAIKSVDQIVDALTMHAFEVDSIDGDTIDIKLLPNRYSDAGSHWGMAREIAAILGTKASIPKVNNPKSATLGGVALAVEIPKESCTRIMARYFDDIKIAPSPEWMQRVLISCGMRPINNLVDITNYVTLETGQPLHALDFQKMEGGKLVVRFAKDKESVTLLDGAKFVLDAETMVLADTQDPLDIAGIKGGRKAEIVADTKTILLTAANFDGPSIYRASKKYGVATDASQRFAHNISSTLIPDAIARASELLVELCGAKAGECIDAIKVRPRVVTLKFDHDQFAALTGMKMPKAKALGYLKALGFAVKGNMVTAPQARTDIERFEDLVDEIVRLVGYDALPATPPHVSLRPTAHSDIVNMKDCIRSVMTRLSFLEAYNYSFVATPAANSAQVQNPISADFAYLRTNLITHLVQNVVDNFKNADHVRFFELGHIFERDGEKITERSALGLAIGNKSVAPMAECRGVVEALLKRLGIIDATFVPVGKTDIHVESGGKMLGMLHAMSAQKIKYAAVAQFDVAQLIAATENEREYKAIIKYPNVVRDISMVVSSATPVGVLLEAIQSASPTLIEDVDLIDYFENEQKIGRAQKSVTFRIIFQSEERTLTDSEVNVMMEKITTLLQNDFKAIIR